MKAGDGNRTHVACLEGRYSTIELHPRFRRRPNRRPKELIAGHKGRLSFMSQVSSAMVRISSGLRPPSQSFILSQFCGNYHRSEPGRVTESHPIRIGIDMGGAGFEPAKALPPDLQSGPFGRLGIHPFQVRSGRRGRKEPTGFTSNRLSRAGGETRTLNPRFTKPMLCRLSYASNLDREIF